MKLLIVTQIVDEKDPGLGFFTRWIEELASKYESVEVICLREGEHHLPKNVAVHSLGKEKVEGLAGGKFLNTIRYTIRFKKYAWNLRKKYDAVFVHMNQEYILVAGPMWKFLGKRIYLWRNHYAGSIFTDIAALYCCKVFCTSKHSYTAKYKKTVFMPVGVDTKNYYPSEEVARSSRSILFLARMSPSKRPEMLIKALSILKQKGVSFTASFVGSPTDEDQEYYTGLSKMVLEYSLPNEITFTPAVPKNRAVDIFRSHEIFVNCSPSGMLDKTMFEAAACGALVFASSEDFKEQMGEDLYFNDELSLATRIEGALSLEKGQRGMLLEILNIATQKNGLHTLVGQLVKQIT